jgi:uncharacterized membrane protein
MMAKSHVIHTPLLIIYFILSSISPKANPAHFVSETMGEYLTEDKFRYEEVQFEFTNDQQVDHHAIEMAKCI